MGSRGRWPLAGSGGAEPLPPAKRYRFDYFVTSPKAILWALLAAANHHLGRDDQARHAVEGLMTRFPELAIETWGFFGLYKRSEDAEHVLVPLRKLGYPLEEYQ